MPKPIEDAIDVFDQQYKTRGLSAQRRYPNESLIQFLASRFFALSEDARRGIRILEVGAGSGANLWMIAKEGFQAYGMDGSTTALKLARKHLSEKWDVRAELREGSFTELPYDSGFFDAVVDVVSLQHLTLEDSRVALKEIARVLKPRGVFFSYRLSDQSVMFKAALEKPKSAWLDAATLVDITDDAMPLAHNGPTSFWSGELAEEMYEGAKLRIKSIERTGRTYSSGAFVEYLAISGEV